MIVTAGMSFYKPGWPSKDYAIETYLSHTGCVRCCCQFRLPAAPGKFLTRCFTTGKITRGKTGVPGLATFCLSTRVERGLSQSFWRRREGRQEVFDP